jgi:hypothetical protein
MENGFHGIGTWGQPLDQLVNVQLTERIMLRSGCDDVSAHPLDLT